MIRRLLCIAAAASLVSCGRVVQPEGMNKNISAPSTAERTEPVTEKVTEAETEPSSTATATEAPIEPTTEGRPEPVKADTKMPEGHKLKKVVSIEGFETVMQCPELPTGCEITALAEVIAYYGFRISKTELCDTFMPIDKMGVLSMDEAYIGDPASDNGFGCNAPVIAKTANDYFDYIGSDWYAVDISGSSLEEVFYQVEQGRPVVVWSTIGQRESRKEKEPNLGIMFNPYQHCLAVFGYNYEDKTVHCADPLVGNAPYDMERFERIYNSMDKQAVVLIGNEKSAGKEYSTDKEKEEWLKKNRPKDEEDKPKEDGE